MSLKIIFNHGFQTHGEIIYSMFQFKQSECVGDISVPRPHSSREIYKTEELGSKVGQKVLPSQSGEGEPALIRAASVSIASELLSPTAKGIESQSL